MLCAPAFNRRRLLIGLASASAAGAAIVAATPALAATAETSLPESAALQALGDELVPAEAEMIASNAALDEVLRRWWWTWPIAPAAIVKHYRDDYTRERGLDGSLIGPDGRRDYDNARPLFSAKDFAREIASVDRTMKQRRPKHPLTAEQLIELEAKRSVLSERLELAREYEAATAQTLEASRYASAKARRDAARKALLSVVSRIMAEPETTMAGVIIRAQALTAWASAPYHAVEVTGWAWPQQLAASLLRMAGEERPKQA